VVATKPDSQGKWILAGFALLALEFGLVPWHLRARRLASLLPVPHVLKRQFAVKSWAW
jgi:hypothetical protein